jgi:hypothetical protein
MFDVFYKTAWKVPNKISDTSARVASSLTYYFGVKTSPTSPSIQITVKAKQHRTKI